MLNFKSPVFKVMDKINLRTLNIALESMNISPSLAYQGLLVLHEPGAGTYEYWNTELSWNEFPEWKPSAASSIRQACEKRLNAYFRCLTSLEASRIQAT